MIWRLIFIFHLQFFVVGSFGQKLINIWPGPAPGSEKWDWHEQIDSLELPGDPLVYNIVEPKLIFYPADPAVTTGTSIIICPGGSFCYLHINTEGIDEARWLNAKGVSAFVLCYRLIHSKTGMPYKERGERSRDTAKAFKLYQALVPLAIADAKQSIIFIRSHAAELGIKKNKIGIMGFSAGGTLAVSAAFDYKSDDRPDFVAPIYAYIPPSLSLTPQKDPPMLFIAAATDDELHLVPMSLNLYSKWLAGGNSAELHIYAKGGHGFGMNKKNLPSDTWIDRFGDWLGAQGLLNR
jgi:acetyl esterase/lipase